MNCRKKEGLSSLIDLGGNESYGIFFRLYELYMEMQTHKEEYTDNFSINESTLVKELGINCRSLPKHIDMLSQTCGIVFHMNTQTIGKHSYNIYNCTLPKSLIFISRRNHNVANKNKNKNKSIDIDTVNSILSYWNRLKIMKMQKMDSKIKMAISMILNDHKTAEIKQAMNNYKKILFSDDYYFTYKWSIVEFLRKGYDKFYDFKTAAANFKNNKGGPGRKRV